MSAEKTTPASGRTQQQPTPQRQIQDLELSLAQPERSKSIADGCRRERAPARPLAGRQQLPEGVGAGEPAIGHGDPRSPQAQVPHQGRILDRGQQQNRGLERPAWKPLGQPLHGGDADHEEVEAKRTLELLEQARVRERTDAEALPLEHGGGPLADETLFLHDERPGSPLSPLRLWVMGHIAQSILYHMIYKVHVCVVEKGPWEAGLARRERQAAYAAVVGAEIRLLDETARKKGGKPS